MIRLRTNAQLKRWKLIEPPTEDTVLFVGFVGNTWGAYTALERSPVVVAIFDGHSSPDLLEHRMRALRKDDPWKLQSLINEAASGRLKATF
jgi:hypothetical protein